MKNAKSWRLILTSMVALLVVGCDIASRKTYQANVALNGEGPLGIAGPPWDGPDGVVLYRTGRNGVICFEAFHSKDLHDRLSAKNGQAVTVEYDTFSDFGRVRGYNVHSVDGMVLANGYHVLRADFAATPVPLVREQVRLATTTVGETSRLRSLTLDECKPISTTAFSIK